MRRRSFIATTAGVGTSIVAGCSSGDGDGSGTDGGGGGGGDGESGTFRLLISDQPAAIGNFDSLDVTLSAARVFRADPEEGLTSGVVTDTENETGDSTDGTTVAQTGDEEDSEDDEADGYVSFDLDSVTVDLTQVVGDRAVSILESELAEGQYSGIELSVADAEGIVDGDAVDVKVPSNRLRIVKPFEVGADDDLSFVFDINVIKKGPQNGYNLLPVIGKSGVQGEDVDVEEVEADADGGTVVQGDTNPSDGGPGDHGPPDGGGN